MFYPGGGYPGIGPDIVAQWSPGSFGLFSPSNHANDVTLFPLLDPQQLQRRAKDEEQPEEELIVDEDDQDVDDQDVDDEDDQDDDDELSVTASNGAAPSEVACSVPLVLNKAPSKGLFKIAGFRFRQPEGGGR